MDKITHKTVGVNGINIHVAELGEGPLVLFLHGFPELWYSWRHQILFLAAQGYRAVAPDLRGFGDTTGAPNDDPSKFTVFHIVGDLIELLRSIAPEEDKVFVVGHDWGAIIAWHLCMFRPDKVKALVNLSVHFFPRHPHLDLVESFRAMYGNEHYICKFQDPGEIEAEFARIGVKTCLQKLFASRRPGPWLPEEDLNYFVSRYEKTGFTGGLNCYRALKLRFAHPLARASCSLHIWSRGAKEYIHNGGFKNDVPLLEDVVALQDVAHFLNQETPEERSEKMEKITHKTVSVNGINMHVAELGKGPLVLLLHGFPELWYSWRHQILFLAARGYRAVAPDLRGYGDTTGAPNDDPSKFTVIHLVGDLIELLQCIAPEEDKVFVVGHDWGAIVAWYLCMFRPEKVKGLVNLSVHFLPRHPHLDLVECLRAVYGNDYYMCRFQEPGDIEAELAPIGVKTCIENIFAFRRAGPLYFPKGKGFSANTDSSTSPASWLSEEDLDYFVSRFEKTGFTGGVNYYRAMKL
nr:putative epoxide hydrolase [Ipomoea batatas]